MVTTQVSALISLPVDTLFNHIVQFESMVDYNSSVQKSTRIVKSSNDFPSFVIKIDIGIKKIEGLYTIKELISNERIVAFCESSDIKFEDTYTFRPEGDKTYFQITDRTQLKGLLSLSEVLLGSIIKMQMNSNLQTLLKILETKYS